MILTFTLHRLDSHLIEYKHSLQYLVEDDFAENKGPKKFLFYVTYLYRDGLSDEPDSPEKQFTATAEVDESDKVFVKWTEETYKMEEADFDSMARLSMRYIDRY